uniref:TolC family protein n=1 Tax=Polaribacter sp. TaxID=1920175 RepID=UPI00404829A6
MKYKSFLVFSLLMLQVVNGQDLESLIKIGVENSPSLQKFELKYLGMSEKKNEVSTLPNTEIGFGYFVSEPETRTGAQRFKVSIKQMIPWFGSISSRENYSKSMAAVSFEDVQIAKRKLILSISKQYYDLYAIKAKQKVVLENKILLNSYEKLALKALEVAKASAVDILRLQMRQNELEQLSAVLEQNYIAQQTALNLLLNREKTWSISVPETLELPISEALFNSQNLDLHPELIQYDRLYSSVMESELLNQKENKPMIGFGLDYIDVSERPAMNFTDNGKDILMPMVSVSIPIFSKKYKSKTLQNELKQQEIKTEKQERMNALMTLLETAKTNRVVARIRFETQVKNSEQARNAEKLLLQNYETGTVNFTDVLEIQELQLKFQTQQIEAVKNYFVQTTIINYLSQ